MGGEATLRRELPLNIMNCSYHLLIFALVLYLNISAVPSNAIYGAKRGRPQYSSLIPFPRVGRSDPGSQLIYYGQKRGGKSGLIAFPRVGRAGGRSWDPEVQDVPDHSELATVPSKRQS